MALNFTLLRRFMKFLSLLNLNPRRSSLCFSAESRLSAKFKPIKLASDLIRIGAIHKLGARA